MWTTFFNINKMWIKSNKKPYLKPKKFYKCSKFNVEMWKSYPHFVNLCVFLAFLSSVFHENKSTFSFFFTNIIILWLKYLNFKIKIARIDKHMN